MFRRRRETDDFDEDLDFADEADDGSDDPRPSEVGEYGADVVHPGAAPTAAPTTHAPTSGPWDFRDKPRDDDVARVDLGGLRVPIPEGVELRVEAQEEIIVAAVLVDGTSQLLLHVFAAPKSSGIWDDVRAEIAESLRQSGGGAEEVSGAFGPELRARIPAEDGGQQSARFVGVDGPRWFLRGLITGPAATDPNQAAKLDGAFRAVVVNRGGEAMAPRDAIPLHLPREIVEGAAQPVDGEQPEPSAQEGADPAPEFELHERGPEITETR